MVANSNEELLQALNLGSFPRDVLDFKESEQYLRQIAFVDYQLHLALQHEKRGSLFIGKVEKTVSAKIEQLIDYLTSVNANYSTTNKSYLEVYYASTVLGHLHLLNNENGLSLEALTGFRMDAAISHSSSAEAEFLDYISARYHTLLGAASHDGYTCWTNFLANLRTYGHTSQVAANRWIDSLTEYIFITISSNGSRLLSFTDFQAQTYSANLCSLVITCNHVLKQRFQKYLAKSFSSDYVAFVTSILNAKIKETKDFPNATDENSDDLNFVQSFYSTLNNISTHRPVITYFIKPKLSKKFLINMTEKTYQSQCVLSNLIRTLIDLEEYDEALAAFKTYVNYVSEEKTQTGHITDILQVIELFSLCIERFNPLNSFIPDARLSHKRFQFNHLDNVVSELATFCDDLQSYLIDSSSTACVSYDNDTSSFKNDSLSFLYHKYNANLSWTNKSKLFTVFSAAWHALGQYYYYLSVYNSPNQDSMKANKDKVLLYYKNSLIVSSTDTLAYLFDYCLCLAHDGQCSDSIKLCKFTLQKFPESFKTWNLLALLATSIENGRDNDDGENSLGSSETNGAGNSEPNGDSERRSASEKFIDNALNIAGIYIMKHRESSVAISNQVKWDIIQLKMTQLAIWEQNHGVEFILEYISEVFVLYRELFTDVKVSHKKNTSCGGARTEGRWSHRPSVIDPHVTSPVAKKTSHSKQKELAMEKIKRLSQITGDAEKDDAKKSLTETAEAKVSHKQEFRILQDIWLWTASLYLKLELYDEAEQCIVEAESVDKPNVKTFTYLGYLTSGTRKFLALQEFERSFELLHSSEERFNKKAYKLNLLGMSQLFLINDNLENSLFVSEKDLDAGIVRLKNYLEDCSMSWPYGYNSPEIWFYLSKIYERIDDRVLQNRALWKCVELETARPVRSYDVCEDFTL